MGVENFKFWFLALLNVTLFSANCSLCEKDDVVARCLENIIEKYLNPEDLIIQINTNIFIVMNFTAVQYDPRKYFSIFSMRRPDA